MEEAKKAAPGESGHNSWNAMVLVIPWLHPGYGKDDDVNEEVDDAGSSISNNKELRMNEKSILESSTEVEHSIEKLHLQAWIKGYYAFVAPMFLVWMGGGYDR